MENFYNERNEFDEELYDNYVKARRRRIRAMIFAFAAGAGAASGYLELTKEEITLNGVKLRSGYYDTLFNPETLDVAILTNKTANGERVDSNYCYNALTNKIVPTAQYEEGYYSLDLMKMVKDGSIESVKTGINKYTIQPTRRVIGDAAQVQFALEYMANKGQPVEVDVPTPNFDIIMVNEYAENDKDRAVLLSPTQDLALFDHNSNTFSYIHLDKENCYDIITGSSVDLNDYVGSSPVNVYHLVEADELVAKKVEGGGTDGKDLYYISASDLVNYVYWNMHNSKSPIVIGSK